MAHAHAIIIVEPKKDNERAAKRKNSTAVSRLRDVVAGWGILQRRERNTIGAIRSRGTRARIVLVHRFDESMGFVFLRGRAVVGGVYGLFARG